MVKTTTVKGATEAAQKFEGLSESLSADILAGAALAGAELIVQSIKRKAPRGRGEGGRHGAEGYKAEIDSKSAKEARAVIGLEDWAFYMRFQETGTVDFPPQPHARPGFDEQSGRAEQKVRSKIREQILSKI